MYLALAYQGFGFALLARTIFGYDLELLHPSRIGHEWSTVLSGAVIEDVYSPHKDELAIDFSTEW